MLATTQDGRDEVNAFLDVMDIDHAVVTPDSGSRTVHVGIVESDAFADQDPMQGWWMQRRVKWHPHAIVIGSDVRGSVVPTGPQGTVFRLGPNRSRPLLGYTREQVATAS